MVNIDIYMKKLLKRFRKLLGMNKGFTLIELLVVIGILGVLAAALVATIDPFEQLKKAQDSNTKNTLVEFLNANVRYYTTHNTFPWTSTGANCNGGNAPDGTVSLTNATLSTCVTALVSDNELKQAFSSATDILKLIYVTYDGVNNEVVGCFQPQSKSQQNDANTKFNSNGSAGGTPKVCTFNADGTPSNLNGGCFWCTK